MSRDFIIPSVETYDFSYYNQQEEYIIENSIPNTFNGQVNGVEITNDGIYFVGDFTTPYKYVTKWNGQTFESLNTDGFPGPAVNYRGDSVISCSDGLYVAFWGSGLQKYNGNTWQKISGVDKYETCFSVTSCSLGILAGFSWEPPSVLMLWNGISVSYLNGGPTAPVYDMVSGSDGVYTVGEFSQFYKWNGNSFTNISSFGGNIESVYSASNGVYCGSSNGIVSKYDGVNNVILTSLGSYVSGMFQHNNYLYVSNYNSIRRYNIENNTWETPFISLNNYSADFKKFGSSAIAVGSFTNYPYNIVLSLKTLNRKFYPFTMLNKPVFLQRRIPYYTYKGE